MPKKPRPVILDSWSVLAYLEDEPEGKQVADIIIEAHEKGAPIMMTAVNIAETWYIVARQTSTHEADHLIADLIRLGIEIKNVDWKLAREAASFKAKVRMSFSDCFAAALAKESKGDLVTGDNEFRQVEREIRIIWLKQ